MKLRRVCVELHGTTGQRSERIALSPGRFHFPRLGATLRGKISGSPVRALREGHRKIKSGNRGLASFLWTLRWWDTLKVRVSILVENFWTNFEFNKRKERTKERQINAIFYVPCDIFQIALILMDLSFKLKICCTGFEVKLLPFPSSQKVNSSLPLRKNPVAPTF